MKTKYEKIREYAIRVGMTPNSVRTMLTRRRLIWNDFGELEPTKARLLYKQDYSDREVTKKRDCYGRYISLNKKERQANMNKEQEIKEILEVLVPLAVKGNVRAAREIKWLNKVLNNTGGRHD